MVVSLNSRLESNEEEDEPRHSLGRERRPTQDSEGQVLALTVLYVPHLLDCLMCAIFRGNDLNPFSGLLPESQGQVLALNVLCVPCLRTNARI